jgi:outer membrane immunogenic protein
VRNLKLIFPATVLFSAILGIDVASAADLPARSYSKTPVVAAAPSWTGCYVGGGGGAGLWNQENTLFIDGPPRVTATQTTTDGGRGFFGTVQDGCDYQYYNLVAGAFGDYDFSSLKGHVSPVVPWLAMRR